MSGKLSFQEIINMQKEFDERHGFIIDKSDSKNKYSQISKDLVGLMGEIGEFSNIIKKINLTIDYQKQLSTKEITSHEDCLREELIDIFIYFIRLADTFNLNLEEEYISKLNKNEIKYSEYGR